MAAIWGILGLFFWDAPLLSFPLEWGGGGQSRSQAFKCRSLFLLPGSLAPPSFWSELRIASQACPNTASRPPALLPCPPFCIVYSLVIFFFCPQSLDSLK